MGGEEKGWGGREIYILKEIGYRRKNILLIFVFIIPALNKVQ